MVHLRLLILSFILLFGLQVAAGDSLKINGLQSMQPVISLRLNAGDIKLLQANDLKSAGDYLALYLLENDTPAQLPVAGNYYIKQDRLYYTTFNTLGFGLAFEVQYKGSHAKEHKRFVMPVSLSSKRAAKVVEMYPLTDTIPYNILMFSVHFSAPMLNDPKAYTSIKVYDSEGVERPDAWRHKSFWIDSNKVMVLMIHPGKVKSDIDYAGPLFDSNKTYTIHIEKELKDITGNLIANDFSRKFYVSGRDSELPKPIFDYFVSPEANTKQPVSLLFNERIDFTSLYKGAEIIDSDGIRVPVSLKARRSDASFQMTPLQNWKHGKYSIILHNTITDLAANRFNRLFEIQNISEIIDDEGFITYHFTVE
jgi:hypothetical protein